MARRFQPHSTPTENIRLILRAIPWKLLILLPLLLLIALPAFYFGSHVGQNAFPALTRYFYGMTGAPPSPAPTPYPPFPANLPHIGSILYTVQNGDACDTILTYQMHLADAGTIFTDLKLNTVKALDASIGQDCHKLQPGMVLALSPQYPLVTFGGVIVKVDATSPQQVIPTPLIKVPQQQLGIDCSGGCLLTIRIAPIVEVHLTVQTIIPVKVNSWIWAQATLARKQVKNFDTYPYADPVASLNGMAMTACDISINDVHDANVPSCNEIMPNTINDDGGAWLFGVTGSSSLDHWHYGLHLPSGTRVLLWLSADNNGNLHFSKGNAVYRYDEGSHVYVGG